MLFVFCMNGFVHDFFLSQHRLFLSVTYYVSADFYIVSPEEVLIEINDVGPELLRNLFQKATA